MRTYHNDYLDHLVEAAFIKRPELIGLEFNRIYSTTKGAWTVLAIDAAGDRQYLLQGRYDVKLDAVYIAEKANERRSAKAQAHGY